MRALASAVPVGVQMDRFGALQALSALLEQLARLIETLPTGAYVSRPAPQVSGGVGEHVRHCLDHVSALVTAPFAHSLSYDRRQRGTSIESDPRSALAEIRRLRSELRRLAPMPLDGRLQLHLSTSRDHAPMEAWTTLGREVAYAIQHTIHHYAVIALLLDRLGIRVPLDFGRAPSTPPS